MIDNIATHDTPEGIELSLIPAGPVPRAGAWLVDFIIRGFMVLAIITGLLVFSKAGVGLALIAYFLINWFYAVFFEVMHAGQTIGKKLFDIMVVTDSGMPVGLQASLMRNLIKLADFFPFGYFVGVVTMLTNRQNKRLGDIVAGTMVVYVPKIKANFLIKTAPAYLLPMPLTIKEQQAILSFAERMHELPSERKAELLDILGPFLQAEHDSIATQEQKLLGLANTIVGNSTDNRHALHPKA